MSVLFVALPVAIALGGLAMYACIRAIRSGQFDDLHSPSVRMLIDEQPVERDSSDDSKNDGGISRK